MKKTSIKLDVIMKDMPSSMFFTFGKFVQSALHERFVDLQLSDLPFELHILVQDCLVLLLQRQPHILHQAKSSFLVGQTGLGFSECLILEAQKYI